MITCLSCEKTKIKANGLCYDHYHANRLNISYEEWRERERARKRESYKAERKDPKRTELSKERARRYGRKKRSTPHGRAIDNIARDLRAVCNKVGSNLAKSNLMKSLYNASELRIHLEKQFTKEMTWNNYGTVWHIDHIKPRKAFLVEYEQGKYESMEDMLRDMNSLKNLKPLNKKENIKKSSYYKGRKY